MKINISILIITCFICISCKKNSDNKNLYTPSNSDVTSTATLEELQQGRSLYVNNCGSCHGLYSPDLYSPVEWNNIMENMAPNTSLSGSEIILVKKYLTRGNVAQ